MQPESSSLVGSRIGKIRIQSLLGKGGMGEVYMGFDEALQRSVAVKTMRRDRPVSPASRQRFLREARTLSKLDHPNICRIFGLVENESYDVLVLELIKGRTLTAAMTTDLGHQEKLSIGESIAEALAAAHDEKIIHRDLKPDNVMLATDGQVKVLDFGVSRIQQAVIAADAAPPALADIDPQLDEDTLDLKDSTLVDTGSEPSTTRPGVMVGTVHYMSPEQAKTQPTTTASDLYSLGIILQELFTGRRAYPPELSFPALLGYVGRGETVALGEVAEEISTLIGELQSADSSLRPTAAQTAERLRWIRKKPARKRRQRLSLAMAVTAVATLVGAVFLTRTLSAPPRLLGAGESARIAFLPFVNATGDPANDWLEQGAMDMVATSIAGLDNVHVLASSEVVSLTEGLRIDSTEQLESRDLGRLNSALGFDLLVSNQVEQEGSDSIFHYRIFKPNGMVVDEELRGPDPLRLAEGLSQAIAVRLRPERALEQSSGGFSSDPFVNRTFAMGIQLLKTAGAKRAQPYFEVALDREPGFIWAGLRLAEAELMLGENATSQRRATISLEEARKRGDPRLEAAALTSLGEVAIETAQHELARSSLSQALALYRELDDRHGEASSLTELSALHWVLADGDRARDALEESTAIFEDLGDRHAIAANHHQAGINAYNRDEEDVAELEWHTALDIRDEIGDRHGQASSFGLLGMIAFDRDELDSAEELYSKAVQLARELGDLTTASNNLSNLSGVYVRRGEHDKAEKVLREALGANDEIGNRRGALACVLNLGYLSLERDDMDATISFYEEGVDRARDLGVPYDLGSAITDLAWILIDAEHMEGVPMLLDEAESIYTRYHPDQLSGLLTVRALYDYTMGNLDKAVEVMRRARETAGDEWHLDGFDKELAVMEESARRGIRLPLPED